NWEFVQKGASIGMYRIFKVGVCFQAAKVVFFREICKNMLRKWRKKPTSATRLQQTRLRAT
ncbi:MAG: hypothetical protein MRZ32_04110, partial [Bacteroidales bacterium]|nr:hypothetical protein [Bacteroidales bacterium]